MLLHNKGNRITSSNEWADIKYKVFATGLADMRRFKIPQCATEDHDILEKTHEYKISLLHIKSNKKPTKSDYDKHCKIISELSQLLHTKGIHKRGY